MKIFNCFDSLACFVGLNLILKTKKHPFRFENSKHYGTVSHQVFKIICTWLCAQGLLLATIVYSQWTQRYWARAGNHWQCAGSRGTVTPYQGPPLAHCGGLRQLRLTKLLLLAPGQPLPCQRRTDVPKFDWLHEATRCTGT